MDDDNLDYAAPDDSGQPSAPRRRRPALSCTVCRRRKLKCDRTLPCGQCVKSKTPDLCVYGRPGPTQDIAPPPSHNLGIVHRSQPVANSSTTPDQVHAPTDRPSPVNSGLYVFDSRNQGASYRVTKPKARPDELQELRTRVQSLEHALARTGSIHTPESLGYESISDNSMRIAPETQGIIHDVRSLSTRACFRGRNGRTRFRGRSSAELTLSCLDDMAAFFAKNSGSLKAEGSEYHKMKKFRGELRCREKQDHQRAYQEKATSLQEMLPPRNIADELLKLYLSTFETTCRILHIPTFLKQYEAYWAAPATTDQTFVAKLLALMAASSCFFGPTIKVNGKDTLHDVAVGWILAVQSWIASSFVTATVKFDMLQIQCLLMIARQAHAADGDVVWITSGSLIRTAMSMGMHRNPLRFSKMTQFWAEMRRRLWATILELDLQASVDAGIPPSIDLDQYDCDPPSNCDDSDLTEDMLESPVSRSSETFTQTSFQTMLLRSLPLRVRIAKAVNSLKFTLPYDEALRLTEDLFQSMNESLAPFPTPSEHDSTLFSRSYMSFLIQRSILLLHRPFSLSISLSQKFAYSRKVCLEWSLEMLSQLELLDDGVADAQAPCLGHMAGGMFRDECFHSALTICAELSLQFREHAAVKSTSPAHTGSLSDLVRSQQDVLVRALDRTLEFFRSRISPKGNGTKAFAFLSMALAGIKARLKGEDSMKRIEEASLQAIRTCEQMMQRAPLADLQGQPEGEFDPSATRTPDLSSGNSEMSFDPMSLLSANPLDFSPLEFGNMFDAADYRMPELWDPNFLDF